ncbi:MAG: restriction endonuclease subunit S [Gallionella sp.]|nr:restriction endonuclease subunit S [Gallionella sp.]
MRQVRLGDFLEVQAGFAFKTEYFTSGDGMPLIRIRDLAKSQTEINYSGAYKPDFVVNNGDYLIGMDGNFRCYRWQGGASLLNQRVCRVRNFREGIEPDYVYYGIQRKLQEIEDTTSFMTVKHLSAKQVQNVEMPLPHLPEQRRIVDLLTRAEGIVRLRREAEQKAAELIPALFMDMFGDPATNPKGWPASSFGAVGVLDRGRSRNRPRDAKELYGGPYPFIQTGDVANSGGRITGYTATYSEAGLAQSRLWKRGTLCITIAANIAKTGVLEFDACFPDSVVGFLPGEQVRTAYVQAWLGFLQPTLEANAPQAAQKNINLEILRNLPVPLPPLTLQETFEQRCSDVISIQSQQAAATAKAQATFDALLAQVFHATKAS